MVAVAVDRRWRDQPGQTLQELERWELTPIGAWSGMRIAERAGDLRLLDGLEALYVRGVEIAWNALYTGVPEHAELPASPNPRVLLTRLGAVIRAVG